MLTMDYPIVTAHHPHKYACSTMSAGTLSRSCSSRNNRVRTVRLMRRINGHMTLNSRQAPSLGFSIRGGHEHGTGLFVSNVETGSEAYAQGLKVGDQIIRINGFAIEDAVHKEVVQLISSLTHVTLKVRGVGMIPVKDKKSDSLSWQIISDTDSSSRSSPQFGEKNRDVIINIFVAARSKLGCGICKGPDWKPGIFVQFTKEGGIAREAGLRPGDQILQCNSVDFADIPFNEAVNLMKTSRQLELLVRKAAASELFPGESSGYNSSASSVTEDQSPSWADSKRLSIVKEENQDLDERLSHKRISHVKKWKMEDWDEEPQEKNKFFKPTIINLSENGTTIKNNGSDSQALDSRATLINDSIKAAPPPMQETQTVVEVHRSDVMDSDDNKVSKSPSVSSFSSLASSSLSSAISMEIQRRVKKQAAKESTINIDEQIQMKKVLKTALNSDQQQHQQHTMLMNEFKQAHQKMFKASDATEATKEKNVIGTDTMDRLVHKDLSQKLSNRLQSLDGAKDKTSSTPPPPPPPLPFKSGFETSTPISSPSSSSIALKSNKIKPKAPPVPIKHSVLSSSFTQPPPCPTPDYDTLSLSSSTSSSIIKPAGQRIDAMAEMNSLDSFKMNNPPSVPPKVPSNYFQKVPLTPQTSNNSLIKTPLAAQLSNSSFSSFKTDTSKNGNDDRPKSLMCGPNNSVNSSFGNDRPKSVHVIVGEYAAVKTKPKRLDFLRNEVEKFNGVADELTQTLNRSNLRKRTESMDDLLNVQQIKPQSNGSVRISLNSGSLSKEFTKSTNDLTDDYDKCLFKSSGKSRIMINVNHDKNNFNDDTSKNNYS